MPQLFRDAGYLTIGGGAVGVGAYDYAKDAGNEYYDGNEEQSWDEYAPLSAEPRPQGFESPNRTAPHVPEWSTAFAPKESEMPDILLAKWAAERLSQAYGQPFFLSVGLYRPHPPWYVPSRFLELVDVKRRMGCSSEAQARSLFDGSPNGPKGSRAGALRAYLASALLADYCVGLLLQALSSGPNAHNTIVITWGDHGYGAGAKGHWDAPLLEMTARVPLLISLPGMQRRGVCNRVVSLLDLYPTVADMCGIRFTHQTDGRSLRPLLERPMTDWPYPAVTESVGAQEGMNRPTAVSVRTEKWRLTRSSTGRDELYDLSRSSGDSRNLLAAGENPSAYVLGVRGRLASLLPPPILEERTLPTSTPTGS